MFGPKGSAISCVLNRRRCNDSTNDIYRLCTFGDRVTTPGYAFTINSGVVSESDGSSQFSKCFNISDMVY